MQIDSGQVARTYKYAYTRSNLSLRQGHRGEGTALVQRSLAVCISTGLVLAIRSTNNYAP